MAAVLLSVGALTAAWALPQPAEAGSRVRPSAGGTSTALATVMAAVEKTLGLGTAAVEMRFSNGQAFGSPGHAISASGSFDFVSAIGSLRLEREMIFAIAQLYLRQPAAPSVDATQKPWTFVDLESSDLLETNLPDFVAQAESINPLLALQQLAWGSVKAKQSGVSATGTQTFTVTVDLAQASSRAAGPAAKALRTALEAQGKLRKKIPVAVTLDKSGRIARLRFTPPGAGVGTVTLSLSRFGSPVNVQLPPKSQVTNLFAVIPHAERENAGGGDSDGA